MRGVHDAIRRELGAAAGGAGGVGDQAGRSIGDRMGAGLSRTLQASTRAAMAGLETVALAGGAAMSAALVKGWGRLTTIQDATAALTVSLQDSAAAGSLLDDVLGVVSGTPFNLDQFASAAQQMVGMGIEAEKVPGYLEAVGEAAATQGGRAQEMAGRLTTVFGQIAASGQVQLADLWRISDTGVNALGILANHFGVARDEMKDMISSGAVPATEALDVLADGILHGTDGPAGATVALAGTMETLRESMSGAVGGIEPAMARLGAAFLEPFSPAIVAGANGLVDTIDRLGGVLGDLAGQGAASGVVERLVDAVEDGPAAVERLVDGLGDLDGVLAVVAGSMAGLATRGLGGLLGTIGVAVPGIGPLAGALGGLVLSSDEARAALADLAGEMLPLFGEAATAVEPFLDAVSDAAGELIPALADVLIVAAEAAVGMVDAGAPLAALLLDLAVPVVVAVLEGVAGALQVMEPILPYVAAGFAAIKVAQVAPSVWRQVVDAFDRLAIKSYEAAGGLSQAAGSAALFGGVAAGGMALLALHQGLDRARRSVERWRAEVEADLDTSSMDSYREAIAEAELQVSRGAAHFEGVDMSSPWDVAKLAVDGFTEVLSPMENDLLDSVAAMEGGEEALAAYRAGLRLLRDQFADVGDQVGLTEDQVQGWVDRLDLDPTNLSVSEMADAIREARNSAEYGTAQTEAMAGAYETLADETSNATEQLDAWKNLLDEVIGAQIDTATTADEFAKAMPELTWQLAELGGSITGMSGEAIDSRLAIAEMAEQALEWAGIIGNTEGPEAGTWALATYRQGIIDAAREAGIAEADIRDLLEQYALTPENITTTITADTSQAQQALDRLAWTLAGMGLSDAAILREQATAGRYIGRTRRWGGIDHYAAGGVRDAMLGSGRNMVWWDEPATGGEAYIPRLGDKARSKQILDVAAGWYGLGVVPQQSAPATAGAGAAGAQAPLVVHTQASDPEGVAAALWREMARR